MKKQEPPAETPPPHLDHAGYLDFWKGIHGRPVDRDRDRGAFDRVLHPGQPLWYNRFFDYADGLYVGRVLRRSAAHGGRALEVGCGGGRWIERLARERPGVTGLDLGLPTLVENAAQYGDLPTHPTFVCGSADRLPFRTGAFRLVTSITCLQHVPYDWKEEAVREVCRVTEVGGDIVLVEYCQDGSEAPAPHMYPLSFQAWVVAFRAAGADLVEVRATRGTWPVGAVRRLFPWLRRSRLTQALYVHVLLRLAVLLATLLTWALYPLPDRRKAGAQESILVFRKGSMGP